jgi:hypothetical protein
MICVLFEMLLNSIITSGVLIVIIKCLFKKKIEKELMDYRNKLSIEFNKTMLIFNDKFSTLTILSKTFLKAFNKINACLKISEAEESYMPDDLTLKQISDLIEDSKDALDDAKRIFSNHEMMLPNNMLKCMITQYETLQFKGVGIRIEPLLFGRIKDVFVKKISNIQKSIFHENQRSKST